MKIFKNYILPLIICAVLVLIDQLIKLIVVDKIELAKEVPVIGDAVVLTYLKNTGAAWSFMSGKTIILVIISVIVIGALVYFYKNLLIDNKYMILRICIIFIIGGAIGNMIDRIRLGYVVDYIYFKIIHFPVFNFADICVTVCMFLMVILLLFKFNSKDMQVLLGEDPDKDKDKDKDKTEKE